MFSVMIKVHFLLKIIREKPCTEWLFLINKAIIAFSYLIMTENAQISYNRLILLSSDVS